MGPSGADRGQSRGETLARLGIGSVAGNREILGPLAKQLEDRHLSPMQITPPPDQGGDSTEKNLV